MPILRWLYQRNDYNWSHHHIYGAYFFQFSSKVKVLISLFAFLQFYPAVSWNGIDHNSAGSTYFLFLLFGLWLGLFVGSRLGDLFVSQHPWEVFSHQLLVVIFSEVKAIESLHKSLKYPSWFYSCRSLRYSKLRFPLSLLHVLRGCNKSSNYGWYHRYHHVQQLFYSFVLLQNEFSRSYRRVTASVLKFLTSFPASSCRIWNRKTNNEGLVDI